MAMDAAVAVSAKRCAVVLGLGVAVLVAGSLGATFLALGAGVDPFPPEVKESVIRLAWVDGEGNIPAWYSASLLLLCSILLAAITAAHKQQPGGRAAHWLILSAIFLFLSLDETVQLHELSIAPLRSALGATGLLYYAWILPAAVCVALFVLAYLPFLRNLPARTRQLFLLAGAVFVGGAMGVEALSGWHASSHGEHNLTYHLIITLEELLEMAGVVLFIYALLDYAGRQFGKLSFHVSAR